MNDQDLCKKNCTDCGRIWCVYYKPRAEKGDTKGGSMTEKLKKCPFCGGKGKVSFKDYKFFGRNVLGEKKLKYRVQVICNKCRARGKPVITDWLINPNPYISKWGNCGDGSSPIGTKQTEMFRPYVEEAINGWNRRA